MSFYVDNGSWYDHQLREKTSQIVVKRYCEDRFLGSCIIPSVMYPLGGAYRMFNFRNTEMITDSHMLDIIDRQEYCIGRCYTNTRKVVEALCAEGYSAKSYVGWMFVSGSEPPIHHCWAVVDDIHIVDLADDYTVMLSGTNGERFQAAATIEEKRELIASFHLEARKYAHRQRCYPIGVPTPRLLYVGCKCSPEAGIVEYQRLMKKFPNHECQRNTNASGFNPTQALLAEHGLMDWAK
jgi:hypothetical protein